MEYLIFWGVAFVVVLFLWIRTYRLEKKKQEQFIQQLITDYGKEPNRMPTLERMQKVSSYLERHKEQGQIDDITWLDLGMDALFHRMDYCLSATGEEYLYYTLHHVLHSAEELAQWEKDICYFQEQEQDRVKVQKLMNQLGFMGKYSLYDYWDQLEHIKTGDNKKQFFCNMLFFLLAGLLPVHLSIALAALSGLIGYRIVTYFQEKKEIEPYVVCFSYFLRLSRISEALIKMDLPVCERSKQTLKACEQPFRDIRKGSFWFLWQSSGNPFDIIIDYVKMIFHTDMIAFHRMYAKFIQYRQPIDEAIGALGQMETSIAIGTFRKSLQQGWCIPEFITENRLSIEQAYHPLLEHAVKNSIHTEKGVLITGSNASGKSTFLRTVAVNAILAQTIHTCTATSYQAPISQIYSSMSLRDNLQGGESYFMVEIKALKRIMEVIRLDKQNVLCFVDEVLRGTNTVERIAASTQILKSLAIPGSICFAATHDHELTWILEGIYDNYHFQEEISNGDILFDYQMLPGRSTTRNAIRLLEMMGYHKKIVEEAARMAEKFVEEGKWLST